MKNISDTGVKETIIDFLINIPLFDEFKGNELDIIAQHMNYFEIKKGKILFKEGDRGDYVCFVVNGKLDVYKQTATEDNVVIATLSKGRSIGEMSIIDKTPRSATVKAKTNSSLISLTQESFDSILKEHPFLGIKILKSILRILSMNMRKTSSRLADYMLPL